jgi:hypothetical protein
MTIERRMGKARPTMTRSRDLRPVKSVPDPSDGRAPAGRFGMGNRISVDSGAKHILAKAMSGDGLDADAALVARDTRKLFMAVLRELPSKGAIVRSNAYGFARETALSAYYDAKANQAGLDSERGMTLATRASYHRQRGERLSVTLLDESATLAEARPSRAIAADDGDAIIAERRRVREQAAIEWAARPPEDVVETRVSDPADPSQDAPEPVEGRWAHARDESVAEGNVAQSRPIGAPSVNVRQAARLERIDQLRERVRTVEGEIAKLEQRKAAGDLSVAELLARRRIAFDGMSRQLAEAEAAHARS